MRCAERPASKPCSMIDAKGTHWLVRPALDPAGTMAGFESEASPEPVGGMAGFEFVCAEAVRRSTNSCHYRPLSGRMLVQVFRWARVKAIISAAWQQRTKDR